MTNATRKRLLDVVLACQAIGRFVAGMDFAAYERDERTRAAVERKLEIVGEALGKAAAVDPDLLQELQS